MVLVVNLGAVLLRGFAGGLTGSAKTQSALNWP
jgi:hypothetical protein